MLTLVGGLARIGHAMQVGSMAAREAARAAVTAPDLDTWRSAGEGAGRAAGAHSGAVGELVVSLAPRGDGGVAPGAVVIVTASAKVPLLGWPFDVAGPEVEVVSHSFARVDPHRARCVGPGCGDGR